MKDTSREEKIKELEMKAKTIKDLKDQHRKRRPIVIEFCGSPKSGKSSSITSLNTFLKRNGFKTYVLSEKASQCPISDKQSPLFNVWTCSSTINEINAIMDTTNPASEDSIDFIICDRGIFDALCWFKWLKKNNHMRDEEYTILTKYATLYRWQKNIDLVYVFLATPEQSIKREYANLLTDKRGSIMREDVLDDYKKAVMETFEEYKESFRATAIIDTSERTQDDVGYEVTLKTLDTLKDMLMEKIGYIYRKDIPSLQTGLHTFSSISGVFPQVHYDLREKVEKNSELLQPIAIAALVTKAGDKILCVKKSDKSTEKGSPEHASLLCYVGGHMRKEDESSTCEKFEDILQNTLERELHEELGITIATGQYTDMFYIYTPDTKKSTMHIAIGKIIYVDEETKFRLDKYELTQSTGTSKSGKFMPITEITESKFKLESWSKAILNDKFPQLFTSQIKMDL